MENAKQRDNSGVLFVNNRKEKETHSDMTGTGIVFGVEVYVNGWYKRDKNGKQYLSWSIKEKEAKKETKEPVANTQDNDLPF